MSVGVGDLNVEILFSVSKSRYCGICRFEVNVTSVWLGETVGEVVPGSDW